MATNSIAKSFRRIARSDDRFAARAYRMSECGSWLGFAREDGNLRLRAANFCKARLCPMCAWRRTLKIGKQISDVADRLEELHPGLRLIFGTFTVRNPDAEHLIPVLDKMFKGWNAMMQHSKMKRIVKGWFRGVEVTYNKKADTYHPHLHALFLVEDSYFHSRDFMKPEEWARMWARSCGFAVEDTRSFKIRKVRSADPSTGSKRYKMVKELAKYSVKDTDITTIKNEEKRDEVLKVFADALHGRRLCAFGGLLKQVAKELGQERLGEGDLVHVEGEDAKIRADILDGLEIFTWSQGVGNYVREKRIRMPSNGGK